MSMYLNKNLATQRLKYDDIKWNEQSKKRWYPESYNEGSLPSIQEAFIENGQFKDIILDSGPSNVVSGMKKDTNIPFWTFDFGLAHVNGIWLSNINVKNTQEKKPPNYNISIEEIFDSITFDELEIEFEDGEITFLDIETALSNKGSYLEFAEDGNGVRWGKPNDKLYQRGVKLVLIDNALDNGIIDPKNAENGYCKVRLELSVVFRGAKNDFDPAAIPVAMGIYPQIGWTWYHEKATKKVKRFRGTVKFVVKNYMFGMNHMQQNVASLFTDSNTAMDNTNRTKHYGTDAIVPAYLWKDPSKWALLFDYKKLYIEREQEFIGVFSKYDFERESKRLSNIEIDEKGEYIWLNDYKLQWGLEPGVPFNIVKNSRQGSYDNIHIHAKMMKNDFDPNNPVHAPFCGHSCIHLHWRWSPYATKDHLSQNNYKFFGWSYMGKAHSTLKAPSIPPNQRLRIALTRKEKDERYGPLFPGDNNYDPDHDEITNSSFPKALDPLNKKIWYSVDIKHPHSEQRQVILEQGCGWAYRYTLYKETPNSVVDTLVRMTIDDITDNNATQKEMNQFFEERIYPYMRYIEGTHKVTGSKEKYLEQIPDGDFKGTNSKSMENL